MWTGFRVTKAIKELQSSDTAKDTSIATGALAATGAVTAASADIAGNIEIGGLLTDGGLIDTAQAIPVTKSAHYEITTAAAETNTLARPTYCGQLLSLRCGVYAVGDRVVTVTGGVNQTTTASATVSLTFGAVGDYILLMGIDVGGTLRWQVIGNDGVAIAHVS